MGEGDWFEEKKKKHWAGGHRPDRAVGQRLRLQGWGERQRGVQREQEGGEMNRDRERKDRDRENRNTAKEGDKGTERYMEERWKKSWRES